MQLRALERVWQSKGVEGGVAFVEIMCGLD